MKPYRCVAVYNQAVQVLKSPGNHHHPSSHSPSQQLHSNQQILVVLSFFFQVPLEITGHCLLAEPAHFNGYSEVHHELSIITHQNQILVLGDHIK